MFKLETTNNWYNLLSKQNCQVTQKLIHFIKSSAAVYLWTLVNKTKILFQHKNAILLIPKFWSVDIYENDHRKTFKIYDF